MAMVTPTVRRAALSSGLVVAAVATSLLVSVWTSAAGAQGEAGERLPTKGPIDQGQEVRDVEKLNLVEGLLDGKPIIDGDFADPFALSEPSGVYIYATNTTSANVPVMEMPKGDATTANYLGDALPKLPSWTVKGFQWAPAVWARPDGRFVLYYSTPGGGPGSKMCISRATSGSPSGPFVDDSSSAFICPDSQGGAIDPSVFVHDGTPYLLWKADGDCCNLPTIIYSQKLSSDGTSVDGSPTELITATQKWEKDLVEGPSMIRQGDDFYLYYSANDWDTAQYAIGAATCSSIEGPCRKTIDKPWMGSEKSSIGPGGQEFFDAPDGTGIWMVHHGWLPGEAGTPGGQRRLYLDKISFSSDGALPTRSNTRAVEEALLKDAAFLALVAGLAIGGVVVLVAFVRRRRKGSATDVGPSEPTPVRASAPSGHFG